MVEIDFEKLRAELYETYRTDHTSGYSIKRKFVDNLSHQEEKALRKGFTDAREKHMKDSLLGHTESFWAMYDELQ